MKKFLSLYLLLSLAAQPLVGMQAAPQPSSNKGTTIAAAVGITGLVAAVIAYLLLAKSDKKVCDEFNAKVVAAVNAGNTAKIDERRTTIRPFFSSEPEHGELAVSRTARFRSCSSKESILSTNNCYRAMVFHDIYTMGPLRYHTLHAAPERNPYHPAWKELDRSTDLLGRDRDRDRDRKQEPLEEKE